MVQYVNISTSEVYITTSGQNKCMAKYTKRYTSGKQEMPRGQMPRG
jgi:hypothetical protein